ncbi:uncharacterized protein [Palaemon carinicauda]|uniref:uncharacterized protein n=1 Tax=Palaemon carinicauda TaxID=392227 RepID=UPI0035B6A2E0
MRMQENEERMEKRMEAMMGQVMGMMKTFMGEGAVGGVSSASSNGLIVEEKLKVRDNGKGSDNDSNSDKKVKGTRYSKDEQKGERKDERKGKSDVKKEKKKCQDENEDGRKWVKVVSKKRARKSIIKDRNMSLELDSLYSSEEVGNKREGSSDDSMKPTPKRESEMVKGIQPARKGVNRKDPDKKRKNYVNAVVKKTLCKTLQI